MFSFQHWLHLWQWSLCDHQHLGHQHRLWLLLADDFCHLHPGRDKDVVVHLGVLVVRLHPLNQVCLHILKATISYSFNCRLYVLVEASEWIRKQHKKIKTELSELKAETKCLGSMLKFEKVLKLFDTNEGFSASGYFNLSRGIIANLVGSLFTYLIVLLQFKDADTRKQF